MTSSDGNGISRADFLRGMASASLAVTPVGKSAQASAQDAPPIPKTGAAAKPATKATLEFNALYRNDLPFDDVQDFKDSHRGLLAALPNPAIIRNAEGTPVWDLSVYGFLGTSETDDAPDTGNPRLWRMVRLNMIHGLFELVDGIYQARGYDLSVMRHCRQHRSSKWSEPAHIATAINPPPLRYMIGMGASTWRSQRLPA